MSPLRKQTCLVCVTAKVGASTAIALPVSIFARGPSNAAKVGTGTAIALPVPIFAGFVTYIIASRVCIAGSIWGCNQGRIVRMGWWEK